MRGRRTMADVKAIDGCKTIGGCRAIGGQPGNSVARLLIRSPRRCSEHLDPSGVVRSGSADKPETKMLPLKSIGLSLVLFATASTDSIDQPPTLYPGSPCAITSPHFIALPTGLGTLKNFLSSGFDRVSPIYCPISTEDRSEFTKQLASDTVDEHRWCGQSARLIPPPDISYLVCRRNPRVCFTFALGSS